MVTGPWLRKKRREGKLLWWPTCHHKKFSDSLCPDVRGLMIQPSLPGPLSAGSTFLLTLQNIVRRSNTIPGSIHMKPVQWVCKSIASSLEEDPPQGRSAPYDSVPLAALSTWAFQEAVHRGASEFRSPPPTHPECVWAGGQCPSSLLPGPCSATSSLLVTPPAFLWQSQWKNRRLLLACPEKRHWGLIKVQSSALTPPLEHEILGFGHRLSDTCVPTCLW